MLRKSRDVGSQMELRSCQRRRSSFRSSTTSVTSVPASAAGDECSPQCPTGKNDDECHQDRQQEQQADPLDRLEGLAGRRLNQRPVRRHFDTGVDQSPVRPRLLGRCWLEGERRVGQGHVGRRREVVVHQSIVDLVCQLTIDETTYLCRVFVRKDGHHLMDGQEARIASTDEALHDGQPLGRPCDGERDEHPEEEGRHAGQCHVYFEIAVSGTHGVRRHGDHGPGDQGRPERGLSLQHGAGCSLKPPGHMRKVAGRWALLRRP